MSRTAALLGAILIAVAVAACSQPRNEDPAANPGAGGGAAGGGGAGGATKPVGDAGGAGPTPPTADGSITAGGDARDVAPMLDVPGSPTTGLACDRGCPVCQQCGPAGTCVAMAANQQDTTPPAMCEHTQVCNGKGQCVLPQSADCQTDDQCLTGHCSRGVCCDRACDGVCEECRATTRPSGRGVCTAVPPGSVETFTCASPSRCAAGRTCGALDQGRDGPPEVELSEGAVRQAQTFIVGISGQLAAIGLTAVCADGETYLLQIQSATATGPTGEVLASQIMSVGGGSFVSSFITLTSPVAVTSGQRLAIVVGPNGGDPRCTLWYTDDNYPDGGRFTLLPDGRWQEDSRYDLIFKTYVAP
jgi:hypothetical protein